MSPSEVNQKIGRTSPLFIKQTQIFPVAFDFHVSDRNKLERGRVDGIPLAGRRGRIGEDVAEM
jgi:hypothetical protein